MCAQKIAVIAGNGTLPGLLITSLKDKGFLPYLVGLHGQTNESLTSYTPATWIHLGQTQKVINALKSENITDIVMIGGVKRPHLFELRPDWETLKFYLGIGFKRRGDDSFLKYLDQYLEGKGFRLRGAYEFLDHLLAPDGLIGKIPPPPHIQDTINFGLQESQDLGRKDIGQSVVVWGDEEWTIARENKKGTNELITRAAQQMGNGVPGSILVKTCKPQQDKRFDLPTIGPDTVRRAAQHGLCGIVVHTGSTFIVDKDEVAKIADKHKMFVVGVPL